MSIRVQAQDFPTLPCDRYLSEARNNPYFLSIHGTQRDKKSSSETFLSAHGLLRTKDPKVVSIKYENKKTAQEYIAETDDKSVTLQSQFEGKRYTIEVTYRGKIAGADFAKSSKNYEYRRFKFDFDTQSVGESSPFCHLATVTAYAGVVGDSSRIVSLSNDNSSCLRMAEVGKRNESNQLVFDDCVWIKNVTKASRNFVPALKATKTGN